MDVGKRLALEALRVAYHKNIISSGPVFQSMQKLDSAIIIQYVIGSNELITKDKYGYVNGFAVAGDDHVFHFAQAFIKDKTVIVSSPAVKNPVAVRYAWSDNPGALNLYNNKGLPAVPFRTDSLPLKTAG